MEKMYGEMQEMKSEMAQMKTKVDKIDSIEKTVLKIENDHGKKLEALFDGYKQNTEKLDRIEAKVSKHEEFIITQVK